MKTIGLCFLILLVTLFGIAIAQEPVANAGLRHDRTNNRRLGSSDSFSSDYDEYLAGTLDQKESSSGKGDSVSSTVMNLLDIKKTVES